MDWHISESPDWNDIGSREDATVFQSREWMAFVAEAQNATPIVLELREGNARLGWFTGLMIRKCGFRILGAPFPGWTTSYMGFTLDPGVSRVEAFKRLVGFSRRELHCLHLEMMDRGISEHDIASLGFRYRLFTGFEMDLRGTEDDLFAAMDASTRRNIRKAEREGVSVVQADDLSFADDFYAQLQEVFKRQGLKPTYPKTRIQSLIKHMQSTGRILLLRALQSNGECIATAVFPSDERRMYFWGGASKTDTRILRPNEAIHWYAIRYWRNAGVTSYDMGGGGEYKAHYGGRRIAVPWIRVSQVPGFELARSVAKHLVAFRQRL